MTPPPRSLSRLVATSPALAVRAFVAARGGTPACPRPSTPTKSRPATTPRHPPRVPCVVTSRLARGGPRLHATGARAARRRRAGAASWACSPADPRPPSAGGAPPGARDRDGRERPDGRRPAGRRPLARRRPRAARRAVRGDRRPPAARLRRGHRRLDHPARRRRRRSTAVHALRRTSGPPSGSRSRASSDAAGSLPLRSWPSGWRPTAKTGPRRPSSSSPPSPSISA